MIHEKHSLENDYKKVQLIVTNYAGKTIKAVSINNKTGNILFDADSLSNGFYYYTLLADGKYFRNDLWQ